MAASEVRITWLGHATVVLDLDGVRVLTDPLLRARNGPLRRRGPRPRRDQWVGAAVTLVSHLHHDHAELASLRLLGDTPVVAGARNAAYLRRRGLNGVGLGDEWYAVGDSGVRVRLVRAEHHSRRMPHRPNGAHGHIVQTPTVTIWIAGDTSIHDDMECIPTWLVRRSTWPWCRSGAGDHGCRPVTSTRGRRLGPALSLALPQPCPTTGEPFTYPGWPRCRGVGWMPRANTSRTPWPRRRPAVDHSSCDRGSRPFCRSVTYWVRTPIPLGLPANQPGVRRPLPPPHHPGTNRLKPTQAQTAVAAAILRQLHHVITHRQAWDPAIAAHGTRTLEVVAA